MAEKKKYVVGNPRDLPEGVPMISWREYTWYEGDEFQAPDGLKFQRLIDQGYLLDPAKVVNDPEPIATEKAEVEEETEEEVDG
jgi:hypothetical protein